MGLLGRRSGHGRWAAPAAGLVLVVVLGGCSFVPDWADPTAWSYRWANPVNWYDGVFSDDDSEITVTTASSIPGEDDAFPDLNSVPERPIAAETVAARAAAGKDEDWRAFLGNTVKFIAEAHTTILMPAAHSPMK